MNQRDPAWTLTLVEPAIRLVETPSAAERTDDELLLLARGGHENAFDDFVRRYQNAAVGFARRQLPGGGGEDAAQMAFLEMFRFLPRYRAEGKARSLFYRILLNQCRRVGRKRWVSTVLAGSSEEVAERYVSDSEATPEDAESHLLARERALDLQRAIDKLPRRHRNVVALRCQGELSYDEIAEVLGIPPGTAKSRMNTAMVRLKVELGGNP